MALLRHGEAATGDAGVGRVLTGRGRRQARAAGTWLKPLGLIRLLATATERAQETAELLVPGLKLEVATGMEGLRIGGDETPLRGVEALSVPYEEPERRPPGGESLIDLQRRAVLGLAGIAAGPETDSAADAVAPGAVAVVAHRFVCNVLVAAALGVELSRAEALLQDPCATNLYAPGEEADAVASSAPRLLTVNVGAADPLRLGPDGRRLPDTETAVEGRRYLLAVEKGSAPPASRCDSGGEEPPAAAGLRAAARLLAPAIEARVELLPPAELATAVAEAADLGPAAAERIPAPPGSVAILDRAAGRTWVRCLGWDPAAPARLAERG